MAVLSSRFPTLLYTSSRSNTSIPLPEFPQRYRLYPNPARKRVTLCASSIKKPRTSRKIMTDAELCDDLREFVALHGLPESKVPSMKELTTHGRKDLANIVRRRGYKLVGELLFPSVEMKSEDLKERLQSSEEKTDWVSEDKSQGQDEKIGNASLLVDEVSTARSKNLVDTWGSVPVSDNQDERRSDSTPTIISNLEEQVTNFIQSGKLDIFEDDIHIVDSSDAKDFECIKSESKTELSQRTSYEEDHEAESGEHNVSGPLNGRTPMVMPSKAPAAQDEVLSDWESLSSRKDLQVEAISGRENQEEINHLKFELHQKELELSKLKEQIEKEKLALSHLQSRAEAEISKAQKLVAEKDAELSAVEETLSGLKEVEIQYRGEGTSVEVAGSFNGWHHQVKMDPQSSSTFHDTSEPRKQRLWSTTIWLYPGVYEIKFIVDGHWMVDPHSESVTRNTIHNNVLRVER